MDVSVLGRSTVTADEVENALLPMVVTPSPTTIFDRQRAFVRKYCGNCEQEPGKKISRTEFAPAKVDVPAVVTVWVW